MFAWSVWNGATYYIDVFGTRFQKELELLKKDVARWQNVAQNGGMISPGLEPADLDLKTPGNLNATAASLASVSKEPIPEFDALNGNESKDQLPGIDGGIGTDDVLVDSVSEENKKDQ